MLEVEQNYAWLSFYWTYFLQTSNPKIFLIITNCSQAKFDVNKAVIVSKLKIYSFMVDLTLEMTTKVKIEERKAIILRKPFGTSRTRLLLWLPSSKVTYVQYLKVDESSVVSPVYMKASYCILLDCVLCILVVHSFLSVGLSVSKKLLPVVSFKLLKYR